MAAKQGNTLGGFYFADYGIDLYSNSLLATEARIRNNSGQVERFVRATYKGIAWAVEHPKEALAIFLKANPASSKVIAKAQFKIAMDHLMTKTAVEKGVGYITKKEMRVTRDMVSKYKRLKTTVPLDDLYTLKYLPKLFPKRGAL